jgi:hypothetical protein
LIARLVNGMIGQTMAAPVFAIEQGALRRTAVVADHAWGESMRPNGVCRRATRPRSASLEFGSRGVFATWLV